MSLASEAIFSANQITSQTEKAFTSWHKILINNPDKNQQEAVQQELLGAVNNGKESLVPLLREKLSLKDFKLGVMPSLPKKLTSEEASQPPMELELELWELWKPLISRKNAAKPIYWNIAYILWIENDFFDDNLYKTLVPRNPKKLDDKTRSVLRNLGGLPRARGNVSVLSDCPLARAWWRCKIIHEATNDLSGSGKPKLTFEAAYRALSKKAIWESLVGNSLRRVTVANNPELRFAIIEYLARPDSKVRDGITCTQLILNLAQLVLGYSPSLLDWKSLSDLVQKAAEGIDSKS